MADRHGIDISNYTSPLTEAQLEWLHENDIFVVIGLQDRSKAARFKAQIKDLDHGYYVDLPGRDIGICEPGAMVWIDIEPGCFTELATILTEELRLGAAGLSPWVYGNKTSIAPVLGGFDPERLSHLKLAYADYRYPDPATFVPFNGWQKPDIWQYSPNGVMGINADLFVWFDAPPLRPPPYVTGARVMFSEPVTLVADPAGLTEWNLDVKLPPDRR